MHTHTPVSLLSTFTAGFLAKETVLYFEPGKGDDRQYNIYTTILTLIFVHPSGMGLSQFIALSLREELR